ncbi:hypothetical protein Poli38472_000794 [Pythium oligandrum]|uniref:Uncharacterized protein n=1 Tax=Pythium oligandrum TaxID=41045 RepID=A0A8K1FIG6_PYTOL|nr:hypothetical protein Poli38472_000794 [Pythium oligandrum]|eukprot:TMW60752.1 hypothetical protein Poli38472_000794 [Pythium oligandrum]
MFSDDALATMETAWSVDSTTERHVHTQKGVASYWQQCKSVSGVSTSDTQACMDDDDLHYETEMYGYHHVYMRRRSLRNSEVSGLPLICSNCGISFFSLRSNSDDMDAYCSGECKWSVIMYREMDRRMYSYRSAQTASSSYSTSNSLDSECGPSNSYHGAEDVISCH